MSLNIAQMSKLSTEAENIEIGRRLCALRESLNLSQVEFAQRIDLSPRAFQNYERGERETPASVIKAIYEVFSVDPLWLLVGPGAAPMRAQRGDDADLLEKVVVSVEQRLARTRRRLEPDKKGRLIKLIYLHFRSKGGFDAEHMSEMVALAG